MLKEKERYVLEEKHKIASWVTEVGRKMPKMIPRFLFWGTEHGILKYIWHKTIYHLRYTLHYMCVLRCSVVSDSLWPQGLQSAKLLCPWNSLGKDTGVGFHFLPWGIFPTQGLNQGLLHCRRIFTVWTESEASLHPGSPPPLTNFCFRFSSSLTDFFPVMFLQAASPANSHVARPFPS